MRFRMALSILAVALIQAACRGQPPSDSPRYEQWRLVAQSDLILKATLAVPIGALRTARQSRNYSFVTLRATVIQALKGTPDSSVVEINYWMGPDRYSPSPQALTTLSGKQVLLFLARANTTDRTGVYFASGTPKALQAIDPAVAQRVREEIENQWWIRAEWQGKLQSQIREMLGRRLDRRSELRAMNELERVSRDTRPDARQGRVRALIQQMLGQQTEQRAFERLERMGQAAVPSMIRLLDNRRPLPLQYMQLSNHSPRAFEAFGQYSPAVVLDAVAALLEQITGESFGFPFNGDSEIERARAVDGWHIYLHYRLGRRSQAQARPKPTQPPARTGRSEAHGAYFPGELGRVGFFRNDDFLRAAVRRQRSRNPFDG